MRQIYVQMYCREERNLHREVRLRRTSVSGENVRSVLHFTLHKAASVHTGQLLQTLAKEADITPINLPEYFRTLGTWEKFYNGTLNEQIFQKRGYLYSPLRTFFDVSELEEYQIILMVRDPRDVLNSHYFSVVKGHLLNHFRIGREWRQDRNRMRRRGIDEHVLDVAPTFFERYREYRDKLLGRPNVLTLRYEEMVLNFPKWLQELCEFLEFEIPSNIINEVIDEANYEKQEEDPSAHKRKITPGDYREKLSSNTIERLNNMGADILKSYGYDR